MIQPSSLSLVLLVQSGSKDTGNKQKEQNDKYGDNYFKRK